MESFPILGPLEWHIIGYEEYRLGHNELVRQGLTSLVPEYHADFEWIAWNSWKLQLPNSWHYGGCTEAWDYHAAKPLRYMADYIMSPAVSRYPTVGVCAWCRRSFESGLAVTDYIQQAEFCCEPHVTIHRRRTYQAWPKLQAAYQYPFRPLPADKLRMLNYFRSLPKVRSELVRIEPIDLPVVEGIQIERVSDGETISKGFTPEDN